MICEGGCGLMAGGATGEAICEAGCGLMAGGATGEAILEGVG